MILQQVRIRANCHRAKGSSLRIFAYYLGNVRQWFHIHAVLTPRQYTSLSVAFSFVAISHLLIKTGNENPHGNIDISASDNGDNNNSNAESTVSQSVNAKPHEPSAKPDESRPEIDLFGGKGEVYHKEIQVFYAKYSKDGKITVKSDFGDKVGDP